MSKLKNTALTLLIGFLACAVLTSAQARVSLDISIGMPAPREVIVQPGGYTTCYNTPAGFENGVWINSHQICEYEDAPDGRVWIAGYWGCDSFRRGGACANWQWRPAHWSHRSRFEYGMHRYPPSRPPGRYYEPRHFEPRDHYHDRDRDYDRRGREYDRR